MCVGSSEPKFTVMRGVRGNRHAAGAGPAAAVAIAVLLAVASGTGCSVRRETRPTPAAVQAPAATEPVVHVVGPGQTLWRIARVYGVDVGDLAAANGIEDATQVEVGRALVIPGATEILEVPAFPAPLPTHPRRLTGSATAATPSFLWPVAGGTVVSGFGAPRGGRRHRGIDIAASSGTAVRAVAAGRVVYAGSGMRGYGKTVIVDHGSGLSSLYAHNSRVLVRHGQRVEPGQQIARVGRTGNATSDHCHFEIRKGEVAVDPLRYLGGAAP